MTNIQNFIVEPSTPELAICARWRANAFSVLQASFEPGNCGRWSYLLRIRAAVVALVAKADGEPVGTCLLVESEIEPNHDVSPWLQAYSLSQSIGRKGVGRRVGPSDRRSSPTTKIFASLPLHYGCCGVLREARLGSARSD